jgi:quercetin dioxygenase-like cupin family protein
MSAPEPGRARTPPRERFAPQEDEVDLQKAAEALWAEPNAGEQHHRQMALFRHGPATIAFYCFEPGSKLPDHVVEGPVFIQVLKGRLKVQTSESTHDLSAGMLLRLSPSVTHDVEAVERCEMLLTVCIEGPHSHSV